MQRETAALAYTLQPPGCTSCPMFTWPWLKMMEAVPRLPLYCFLLLPGLLLCIRAAAALPITEVPDLQETIRVNVTTLKENEEVHEQVVLNFTFFHGHAYINDFPVKSGVTRMKFDTLISANGDQNNSTALEHEGDISVRILVHEWPLASGSDSKLIVVEEEVTEIDGNWAQQGETVVLEILVNSDLRMLRQSRYTVALKESMLYSIPRDSDVLFTLPNPSGKEDAQGPLQTTSQYLSRLVETTMDEEPLPGKLPETPLRAEPPDSYKVMCKWVEDLRNELSRFWFKALPVFFSFMQVVVVGIAGAFIILQLLEVFIPSCEHKGILYHGDISDLPVVAIPLLLEIPEKMEDVLEEDSLSCAKQ